jgi:hypothetical protein
MTVLLGLVFLLSNVTSAITQDQKDWSPERALNYLARQCFEQPLNFTPPRPPSGATWTQTVNGDAYCNWLAARQLRDGLRQYKDPGGRRGNRGNCPKGGTFTDQLNPKDQLHAECTCYEDNPECWVWTTREEWGKAGPN